MKNNFLLTDEMLWDYADGFLDDQSKLQVDQYLQQHPEHEKRLKSILAEKQLFASIPAEKPRKGFADSVMSAWVAEQATMKASSPVKTRDWVVSVLMGAMCLLLLGLFGLMFILAPDLEPTAMPSIEDYASKMPVIDWGLLFESPVLRYGMMFAFALLAIKTLEKYLLQRKLSTALSSRL
ncbi:MAG: hypothetical protein R3A50_08315 [Saprospiraceae bacterium]|nr:hypothetical protein [Lewinellaceae bacterium]